MLGQVKHCLTEAISADLVSKRSLASGVLVEAFLDPIVVLTATSCQCLTHVVREQIQEYPETGAVNSAGRNLFAMKTHCVFW